MVSRGTIRVSLVACGLAAALAVLALNSTARADIVWSTAVNISNDSDVLAAGNTVYAYDWANANLSVNGVNFTGTSVNTGAVHANLNLGVGCGSLATFSYSGAPFTSLPADYQALLSGLVYGQSTANSTTVTLNNLQSGHHYAVQVWASDGNVLNTTYSTLTSGVSTQALSPNTANTQPNGVGQYSIGYFTASGASQSYILSGALPSMNAMQVRDVTNIGFWNGTNGSSWDQNTTANFCTNFYTAPFANGTFAAATAIVPSVSFGDYYYDGSGTVAVTQNSVTVGTGGVSAAAVNFINNAVPYTISTADSVGISGSSSVNITGGGTVTLQGTNTYTGATTIANGLLNFTAAAIPLSNPGNQILFGSSGTLQWASGNTQDVSANLTALTAGQTATLDTNGNNVAFASTNAFTGGATGTLVKTGQGTLTVPINHSWSPLVPAFVVNTAAGGSNQHIAGGAMWRKPAGDGGNPASAELRNQSRLSLDRRLWQRKQRHGRRQRRLALHRQRHDGLGRPRHVPRPSLQQRAEHQRRDLAGHFGKKLRPGLLRRQRPPNQHDQSERGPPLPQRRRRRRRPL